MAKRVRIASVLFSTKAKRGADSAREIVLAETAGALEGVRGFGVDLVVLSEGVSAVGQRVEEAESVDEPGPFLGTYMDFASSERCHVAGPVKLVEGADVFNSIAFVGPRGQVLGAYNKVHLTIGEIQSGLRSGRSAVVLDTAIGRLGGVICFDLNFEAIRKAYRAERPDILAFASMYHGGLMQQVWAYDCRSFFASALPFIGGGIIDPFGRALALTDCYSPVAIADVNLDRVMVHLDYNRERFPEIKRKYLDEVDIDVPPNVGPALITSASDKRTARDIAQEFGLELLDAYLERSKDANRRNRIAQQFGRKRACSSRHSGVS